ncbi:MAG TPA: hypothetical protein VNL98_00390 [Gemmatimonadales bacterium]|nr:hypothetical protein [Gemmatimonadales bacterium]
MAKRQTVVLGLAVAVAMGWMVYSSFQRVEHSCELTVEFNGMRRTARGAGATVDEARQGARTAICGVLANGMDESIRCNNTPPVTETCS